MVDPAEAGASRSVAAGTAVYVFDTGVTQATFKGTEFYQMRQNDLFPTNKEQVEGILCQGKKIRQQLKNLQAGQNLTLEGVQVSQGVELVTKKGGLDIKILDSEYTLNRLTGMCAAYCVSQEASFSLKCAMAVSLGLDVNKDRILYYSAAPGAKHFTNKFGYNPLLCALKQLKLKKVTKENIARIAAVKDETGKTLSELLIEARAAQPVKLQRFGTSGTRGVAELEKALNAIRGCSVDVQLHARKNSNDT